MRCHSVLLSAAVVLASGLVAQAVSVTNVTNSNTVVFYDNFEGVTASPLNVLDGSGDFDPVAVTGTWSNIFESHGSVPAASQEIIQVTGGGPPFAPEGSSSMRIYRDESYNGNELTGSFAAQNTTNDIVHMETMIYLEPGAASARFQLVLLGAGGDTVADSRAWIRNNGAGLAAIVADVGNGLEAINTPVPYSTGVWQKWEIDYAIDSASFTLTVDGISQSGLAANVPGDVTHLRIVNGAVSAGSVYFDAVPIPEPSSIALLLFGTVGLVAAGRRRRK